MPVFSYISKDLEGAYHRGEVESSNEFNAARILRRKRLIVISFKEKKDTGGSFITRFTNKIPFSDVVVMTRQLATMISAGLILSEAVDILAEQQTSKSFKKVLTNISADLKGGSDFATAIAKYPDVFPTIYSRLVRAGQASGKLDVILEQLATTLEKDKEFRSKVRGAMIYPIVVVGMMVLVMVIMLVFVIPKLLGLYSDSGIELPLPTKIMLAASSLFVNFWWAIIIVLVLLVMGFKKFTSTAEGKLFIDKLILKAPILGKVVKLVLMTTFIRTFALIISAGISILDAISISANVLSNSVYRNSLQLAYQGVERGLPLSTQLLAIDSFPKMVGQMVRIGEETGKLDEIMFKLAEYYEAEADGMLKNIITLIEPLVLILLGIGVAFLVVSIILPIYQLTTNIGN